MPLVLRTQWMPTSRRTERIYMVLRGKVLRQCLEITPGRVIGDYALGDVRYKLLPSKPAQQFNAALAGPNTSDFSGAH